MTGIVVVSSEERPMTDASRATAVSTKWDEVASSARRSRSVSLCSFGS